ncbi:MAG TPA: hypothetical protein PKC58_17425 [Ignavibacteria bacterium]|nr:hypothetical protein [Ignavibacteria bacterium]
METFKTKTTVKKNHKIEIENVPFENGQEVIVSVTQNSNLSTEDIMKLEDKGGAFDFLNDPREDIYTVKDLKVRYK